MKAHYISIFIMLGLLLSACGGAPVATEPPVTEVPPTEAPGTDAPAATEAAAPVRGDVVILVVDDFAFPDSVKKAEMYKGNPNDQNCIVQPDGQIFGATGTTVGGEYPTDSGGNPISHGDSVYNDLLVRFAGFSNPVADQMLADPSFPWLKRMSIWDTGLGILVIAGVDTGGYTTTFVRDNINSAIASFNSGMDVLLSDGSSNWHVDPISQLVINMSFAIVPCKTANISSEAYQATLHNDQALADLEKSLRDTVDPGLSDEQKSQMVKPAVLMGDAYEADIEGIRFLNPNQALFSSDPLYLLLVEQKDNPDVVLVASAGNLGPYFEFPFAPAIWDFVISVSSEGANSGSMPDTAQCFHAGITDYSNCGEIRMDGVSLDYSANVGTSYAAPKLAYNLALYLMEDKFSGCAPPVNTALSVFGYATDAGNWENLGFDEAFSGFCVP